MTLDELEVLKDFIAKMDYHLNKRDTYKANKEMNNMCTYILQKEGLIKGTNDIHESLVRRTSDMFIHKRKEKPIIRMGMSEQPTIPIPHTRY
jgi:hypothetical protein